MKQFFIKIGSWFKNHLPTRRRIIQVYAALLTNANLKGFVEGQIYTGNTKKLCTPGLNCYSCPGAVVACPLGALQNSLGSSGTTTPYYIIGIIALFGLALGRTICGFLCPFGFFQELLYKVRTPKVKKSVYTRLLSYLKYVFLIVLVIAVPLIYHNVPGFCKYICPAGTFGGAGGLLSNVGNSDLYAMLGYLFSWKSILLVVCIVACVFIYRAFCRFICPLGAIYGFFNKVALLGVKLDKSQCIDCGACIAHCKMDIKHVGDHECINCGECISVCPTKAISWKGSKIFLKATSVSVSANGAPAEEIKPLNVLLTNGTTATAETAAVGYAATERPAVETPATQTESVNDGNSTEPAQSKSKFKTALKRLNKRAFVLEAVAWVLATAVVVGALVYYNIQPSSLTTIGAKIEDFTAKTYVTAYGGDEYNFYQDYETDRKPAVLVFWSSRNEASKTYLSSLGEIQEQIKDTAKVVAVHIENSDTAEIVQGIIDSEGWNKYDIPFIQDTQEIGLYAECGGDGSFPTTVFLNENARFYSRHNRPLAVEEIQEELKAVQKDTRYVVGDKIMDFTVDTFESAYKGETFSSNDALGKVFVLNFWFASCGPCVEELPYFEQVKEEYGDRIVMVAIHANNDEVGRAQFFIDAEDAKNNKTSWSDWQIIFGRDRSFEDMRDEIFTRCGGKASYPITLVVNAEGIITFVRQGAIINSGKDDLRPAIEAALNG